jgi:Icc-related predicted phosphoesterase
MKILAFSDLHVEEATAQALVRAIASADLVIGAGDFAQMHDGLSETMNWLAPMAEKAVYVPGNNETEDALRAATGAMVLHGEVVTLNGVTIAGIGCAIPELPPMPWGSVDLSEDAAEQMLSTFSHADILVSHSPPHMACDAHAKMGYIGSISLRNAIERLQPEWVLCGHVHDAWGQEAMIGRSRVRNLGPGVTWLEV